MWTAQEISKLRQYLQMTQAEFADAIKTTRQTIIRWENDQSRQNYKAINELNRLWEAIPKAKRHTIKPIWYYPTNSFGDFLWVKVAQKYRNGRWSKWYWYPVDKVSNFHFFGAHTLVFQTIGHFEYQDTQSKQLSNLAFDWDVGGENVDEWKKNFSRCRHSTLLDDDDTHIVNTILEARAYIAKKIDLSVFYQRDAIFTSPPGIGKTTTGIQTLEPILPRFIYAGPRHENCDYVVENITQKENWTRILPRRPLSSKPKDKNLIAQWKAEALCPLFELADKLASLRYNVGKILCAEGKEGKNPNWCGIKKEECRWWNQFVTDKSASIVHEYLFIPTLMDLLIGKQRCHQDSKTQSKENLETSSLRGKERLLIQKK